jgi:hypothetical protein
VVPVSIDQLRAPVASGSRPDWVLVQNDSSSLEPDYALVDERAFGSRRRLLLWHLRTAAP